MSSWDVLHVNTLEVEHNVPDADVRKALADGRYSRDDCVRRPGDDRWWRIYELSEFRQSSGDVPTVLDEAPRLEQEGSLRQLLADAEPPPELPKKKRRPMPVVAPPPKPTAPPVAPAETGGQAEEDVLAFPKKRKPDEEDLDMAPAATVAFLLILFFVIVSGVAIQMALAFPKPSGDDRAQAKPEIQKLEDLQKDNIVVKIKADNSIFIDEELVKESDLVTKITTHKRNRGATDLIINAEDAAYHQTVVAVVDAANLSGIQNIKLASVTKSVKTPSRKRQIKS